MIDLNSIKKGKEILPLKVGIYGVEGIGKSSWAASFPAPIFTQTEDRLSHIDADKFPLVESFDDAMETLKILYKGDHKYQTHVTDSVDALEKLIHKKVCADAGEEAVVSNKKGSDLAYGRGYLMAENIFRQYLKGLEALRSKRSMNIVLVGHSEIRRFDDPMRESYDRYQLNLHKRIRAMLKQWLDCLFFANYEILLKTEEKGFGAKDKKAIGAGRRIISTEERPSFDAKNSYSLPFEIEMVEGAGYSALNEHYQSWAGVSKTKTVKTKKEN